MALVELVEAAEGEDEPRVEQAEAAEAEHVDDEDEPRVELMDQLMALVEQVEAAEAEDEPRVEQAVGAEWVEPLAVVGAELVGLYHY